ncbi:ribosome assembly cofactor RimP [Porphyromonadaceae bacterium]
MISKEEIAALVETLLEGSENYLVDIKVNSGNIIIVEIDNDSGVSIDDCAMLSRSMEEKMDREAEDFELEVGSAGLTSPFKVVRQYLKNIGNEVEVVTKEGKKLAGILKSANETDFSITITKKVKPEGVKRKIEVEEEIGWSYTEVKSVKYLLKV